MCTNKIDMIVLNTIFTYLSTSTPGEPDTDFPD